MFLYTEKDSGSPSILTQHRVSPTSQEFPNEESCIYFVYRSTQRFTRPAICKQVGGLSDRTFSLWQYRKLKLFGGAYYLLQHSCVAVTL